MKQDRTAEAWYRYPIMWLVVAPPIGAVLAGIVTFALILEHPDPVLETPQTAVTAPHAGKANSLVPPTE
jgi:hypothetical protein